MLTYALRGLSLVAFSMMSGVTPSWINFFLSSFRLTPAGTSLTLKPSSTISVIPPSFRVSQTSSRTPSLRSSGP